MGKKEDELENAFITHASECPCFEDGFCLAQARREMNKGQYTYGSCMEGNCHSYFWAKTFAEILIQEAAVGVFSRQT